MNITYTGKCFDDANVETMIFQLNNLMDDTGIVSYYDNLETSSSYECDKQVFKQNIMNRFFVPNQQNMDLYNGIQSRIINTYEKSKKTLTRDTSIPSNARRETIQSHSKSLAENTITLLGLISDGDQGLVTGNNSKYIGVICNDMTEADTIESDFVNILNREGNMEISLDEFRANKDLYYEKAEKLKSQKKKPALFGKFFLYKVIAESDVRKYEDLDPSSQKNGTDGDCWIIYNRGNSEGLRWDVRQTEVINWRKEYVCELKNNSNSRWQGESYYSTTGFGWVDYFTDSLKAFRVTVGPYSKNVIKMHSFCPLVDDKYVIAVLNSDFMAAYVKNMITITHTLQINDGRLIPIVIPTPEQHQNIVSIVDRIINGESEDKCMIELNEKIKLLYRPYMDGLS